MRCLGSLVVVVFACNPSPRDFRGGTATNLDSGSQSDASTSTTTEGEASEADLPDGSVTEGEAADVDSTDDAGVEPSPDDQRPDAASEVGADVGDPGNDESPTDYDVTQRPDAGMSELQPSPVDCEEDTCSNTETPNDCSDGTVNEDCACTPGEARSCSQSGYLGACAGGTQNCGSDGAWGSCSAAPLPYDACAAGDDSSCDGEANQPLNPTCECIEGDARCVADNPSTQRQTCTASGTWSSSTDCPFVCLGDGICGGSCVPGSRQCSGSSPQVCANDGQWGDETACASTTPCQGGTCLPCPTGTFASGGLCLPWTACQPGQFVASGGTSTSDRSCFACSTGFTATANAASCTPWTPCSPGSVEIAAGTPSADRVCNSIPSCDGLASNCGSAGDESCCASLSVAGGTYSRINDGEYPASIGTFDLDKFEVTVGRFRNFKAAWDEGWEPRPGSGKHEHLNGELGLSNSEGSSANELGWKDSWDAYLTLSDESLACSTSAATWTTTSGANEKRPISCVNWFEAYAFCIWDGGFLPSEAEWNYAAAGGNDQRQYPWGATAPGSNTSRAVHGCYYGASGTCTGVANVAPVGSSPNGYGKYGQADLAGNVWEWVLDTWEADGVSFADDCNDCAYLPTTETYRVFRGGSYLNAASALVTTARYYDSPEFPNSGIGVRCARMP